MVVACLPYNRKSQTSMSWWYIQVKLLWLGGRKITFHSYAVRCLLTDSSMGALGIECGTKVVEVLPSESVPSHRETDHKWSCKDALYLQTKNRGERAMVAARGIIYLGCHRRWHLCIHLCNVNEPALEGWRGGGDMRGMRIQEDWWSKGPGVRSSLWVWDSRQEDIQFILSV